MAGKRGSYLMVVVRGAVLASRRRFVKVLLGLPASTPRPSCAAARLCPSSPPVASTGARPHGLATWREPQQAPALHASPEGWACVSTRVTILDYAT